MNDMTMAGLGHNNPPDPIDQICAAYDASRVEAENWTDGTPVENEAQMKAVDALRKSMREWRLELEKGQKSATAPLYDAYKAEGARWMPTIEDAKRIEGCLVAAVDGFKRKLAAEKAEAERQAAMEAARKRREAEEAARAANAADLDAQREAAEKLRQAEQANANLAAARKATESATKGTRAVTRYEITDHKELLHWIATNRRDDLTAFIEDWARKNHKPDPQANGLRVWQDKEAY